MVIHSGKTRSGGTMPGAIQRKSAVMRGHLSGTAIAA
jgi:hypothetical protein